MSKSTLISFILFISIFFGSRQIALTQRSDTLYLNAGWQICEKPFASYYRFGKIVIDTFWYYTGRVLDYYKNDTLEMDGNYSSIGEKDGRFYFFYRDGTPKARGSYTANHKTGIWEYFHRNGTLRLRIDYAGDDRNFTVIDFMDSTGKALTKDSTGSFELYVSYLGGRNIYRLEGECKEGKRSGTWKYYAFVPYKNREEVMVKEVYEKGELKKGSIYTVYSGLDETYKKPRDLFTLPDYDKLIVTESFSKDRTSFRNRNDDQDLADYLIKRQAPAFNVEAESFEESIEGMLKTLNTTSVIRYFNSPDKIYNGEILLNLSDSGDIEELEISGNLTEKEKEYMLFFLQKFKNIHEIMVESVSIDAYHKIYFYTVIFAEFVPKRFLDHFPEKQFVFAFLPYDKLKEAVKRKNKKEKKN